MNASTRTEAARNFPFIKALAVLAAIFAVSRWTLLCTAAVLLSCYSCRYLAGGMFRRGVVQKSEKDSLNRAFHIDALKIYQLFPMFCIGVSTFLFGLLFGPYLQTAWREKGLLAVLDVVFYILLLAFMALAPLLYLYDRKKLWKVLHYKDTEYYRQTHIPFHEMVADKGLCGEFLAYLYFSDLPVYNRVLMNAIIPRENGDFSEIDLICLTPGRIMVVESKNRGGRLRGNLSDPKWVQILPGCENPMGNPIMQNETHIFVLQNYINSHIGSSISSLADSTTYTNAIFMANYESGIDCFYDCPTLTFPHAILYPCQVEDLRAAASENLYSKEQIDQMADLLYPATQYTKEERRAFVVSRGYKRR